jgi:hypothetical protein
MGPLIAAARLGELDGTIEAVIVSDDDEGVVESIRTKSLVLALGGYQDFAQSSLMEPLPGVSLRSIDPAKIMLSDRLFSSKGVRDALLSLGTRPDRQVVILGGSHSAFSAAWMLTNLLPPGTFSAGSDRPSARRIWQPLSTERRSRSAINGTGCPRAPKNGTVRGRYPSAQMIRSASSS